MRAAAVKDSAAGTGPYQLTTGASYLAERTNYVENCAYLWTYGAAADVSLTLPRNFSAVARFTGVHCSGNYGEASVGILTFNVGPRYTQPIPHWRWLRGQDAQVYGQELIGVAHGFDSVFPSATGTTTTANSFASSTGGGLAVNWRHGITLRLIETDYLRTGFPNGTTSAQNQFLLDSGLDVNLGTIFRRNKK